MAEVRATVDRFADDLWRESEAGDDRPTIAVGPSGRVFHVEHFERASGQRALGDTLDLFALFGEGPDLRVPDAHLRIVPGRCAGEPHLLGTRLTTRTIAALAERGYAWTPSRRSTRTRKPTPWARRCASSSGWCTLPTDGGSHASRSRPQLP